MGLTGMRVLVLEDEYLIGLDLERIADECGAKSVHLTATIGDLQAWIDSNVECDIAILEVQARGVSSLGAAEILRQRGIPIIFTTAYDLDRGGIPEFPGVPVVGKPYGKSHILQAAARAFGSVETRPASRNSD